MTKEMKVRVGFASGVPGLAMTRAADIGGFCAAMAEHCEAGQDAEEAMKWSLAEGEMMCVCRGLRDDLLAALDQVESRIQVVGGNHTPRSKRS